MTAGQKLDKLGEALDKKVNSAKVFGKRVKRVATHPYQTAKDAEKVEEYQKIVDEYNKAKDAATKAQLKKALSIADLKVKSANAKNITSKVAKAIFDGDKSTTIKSAVKAAKDENAKNTIKSLVSDSAKPEMLDPKKVADLASTHDSITNLGKLGAAMAAGALAYKGAKKLHHAVQRYRADRLKKYIGQQAGNARRSAVRVARINGDIAKGNEKIERELEKLEDQRSQVNEG